MNIWALMVMKSAAKCDVHGEMQIFENNKRFACICSHIGPIGFG